MNLCIGCPGYRGEVVLVAKCTEVKASSETTWHCPRWAELKAQGR